MNLNSVTKGRIGIGQGVKIREKGGNSCDATHDSPKSAVLPLLLLSRMPSRTFVILFCYFWGHISTFMVSSMLLWWSHSHRLIYCGHTPSHGRQVSLVFGKRRLIFLCRLYVVPVGFDYFFVLIWFRWVTLGWFDTSNHQKQTTITYSRSHGLSAGGER